MKIFILSIFCYVNFFKPLDNAQSRCYNNINGGKFMGLLGDAYEKMWNAILSVGHTK